jgi:glycosyltransferase involved in cell wall biosynthesis
MPDAIMRLGEQPGIEVVGPVDDLGPAYAEATLAIAPLHAGAGTRLKLIEAAAYAVPSVTTSLAARGLGFATRETAWFADDADAFASAVLDALADPAARARRAGRARALAEATHERTRLVERLASHFESVLARSRADRGEP